MAEIDLSTPHGRLNVHGWRKDTMQAAADLAQTLVVSADTHGEFVDFDETQAYLKASALRGRAARRHGVAQLLLRRHVPRVREYNNLSWLIERHFQAALPLAAGVFFEGRWPHYQFLLTQRVADARPLDEYWLAADAADRIGVMEELGRELARMHALGFLHHDLYPRNLLVRPRDQARRIVFLDAWAGGPPTQLRRPSYDLGALFLEGADIFEPEAQAELLEVYFSQRSAQGRPVERKKMLRAASRERARLRMQLIREPHRRRGRAVPSEAWELATSGS